MKTPKIPINFLAIIAGIIFLISGFSKSIDFNYFNAVLKDYFPKYTDFLSLGVIFVELALGTMLFFRSALKFTSLVCFFVVLIFTLVYTYGLCFLGIHECGCFGRIRFFNSSPIFLYVRNAILLLVLALIYKAEKSEAKNDSKITLSNYIATFFIIFIAICTCNLSQSPTAEIRTDKIDTLTSIKDHPLGNYIDVSNDSTYLVSVFSYDCPFCINSFGNLCQYNNKEVVDRVIGLCIENEDSKRRFMDFFKPKFEIMDLPEKDIYNISEELPISFFIRNDTIRMVIVGEIPSAFFLKTY